MLNSGLNIYIINIDPNMKQHILDSDNLTVIENEENFEYISEDEILVFWDEKLYLKNKISNQVIVLINSKLQIKDEDFLVINNEIVNEKSKSSFTSKENLFSKIVDMDNLQLFDFIQTNEENINNYYDLNQKIIDEVDLNLLKIKLVSLWKF